MTKSDSLLMSPTSQEAENPKQPSCLNNNKPTNNKKITRNDFIIFCFLLSLPLTRMLSGVNLLLFAALCVNAFIQKPKANVVPRSLLVLSGIALFYAALSSFKIFPSVWTRFFSVSAIPQQALYALALPTACYMFIQFFQKRLITSRTRKNIALCLVALWIYTKIFEIATTEALTISSILGVQTLGNHSALIVVATCIFLSTLRSYKERITTLGLFFTLSMLSSFSQNKVYAIVFLAIWLLPNHSFKILVSFIGSACIFYIATIADPLFVYFIDENLSVRLILIRDAIDGFVNSHWIGVGFGTESIRNYYPAFENPVFKNEDDPGFIHLAVHNSYATVLFRLGIIGFLALIAFFFQMLLICRTGPRNEKALKCSLFTAFFIVTFQNPALESFVYLYGVCIFISVILAVSRQHILYPESLK